MPKDLKLFTMSPKKKLSADSLSYYLQAKDPTKLAMSDRIARIFLYLVDLTAYSKNFGWSLGKTKASTDYIMTFYFNNYVTDEDTGELEEVKTQEKVYGSGLLDLLSNIESKFEQWAEEQEALEAIQAEGGFTESEPF